MSLKMKNDGGTFKTVPPGTYAARCIRIIELGTQPGIYEGKPRSRKQVLIGFELPTEIIPDGDRAGEPYMVSNFYTATLGEKANLRKDLEAWRGKPFTKEEAEGGFDLTTIIGKPCQISIGKKESGKEKINGIAQLMKGIDCPRQVNKSVIFDLDLWMAGDAGMAKVFDDFSDNMKAMIKKSEEYSRSTDGVMTGEEGGHHEQEPEYKDPGFNPDDDIPF